MTDDEPTPGNPDLPSKYHQHAGGAENFDPDTVHPKRPSGTPPPPRNPNRTRNLILSAVGAVLALAVLIGIVAATVGNRSKPEQAAATSTGFQLPPKPDSCVDGVAGEAHPGTGLDVGDVLVERKSFPRGWTTSDERLPLATAAQLLSAPDEAPAAVSGPAASSSKDSSAPTSAVGRTAAGLPPLFGLITVDKADGTSLREVGDTFLKCLVYLPRYDGVEAVPPVVTNAEEQTTENGVNYVHLAARLTTGEGADRGGDAVYLVVIGTEPTTIAVGIAPLGDEAAQKQLQQALSGLQIRAPQK